MALSQDDPRFTQRTDLAQEYKSMLPPESVIERNITPTTLVVLTTGAPAAMCLDPDELYDMRLLVERLMDGSVDSDQFGEMAASRNCSFALTGSWGEAVRAHANGALLVDIQYLHKVPEEVLREMGSLFWIDTNYMRDIATKEHAQALVNEAFD